MIPFSKRHAIGIKEAVDQAEGTFLPNNYTFVHQHIKETLPNPTMTNSLLR
jgi:hypothetical protein